jgi:hypothetical protein
MAEPDGSGIFARLWRLPGQSLLAPINATALLMPVILLLMRSVLFGAPQPRRSSVARSTNRVHRLRTPLPSRALPQRLTPCRYVWSWWPLHKLDTGFRKGDAGRAQFRYQGG